MVLGLIGGPAAAVSQAAPGSDTTVVASLLRIPAKATGAGIATCPSGMRAVGGGVNTLGSAPTIDTPYFVELSGPLDETRSVANTIDGDIARAWYSSIYNGFGSPVDFHVYALCSATSDATVAVKPLTIPPASGASESATCPLGQRAISGGVNSLGPAPTISMYYRLELSGPLDETGFIANTDDGDIARGWFAYVFNAFANTQNTFRVYALCSQASDATVALKSFTLGTGQRAAAIASCPPGRRALGGGINTLGSAPTPFIFYYVELFGPLDETGFIASTLDGDVARSWYASIYNAGVPTSEFRVYALCATDPGTSPDGPGGGTGGGGAGGGTGDGGAGGGSGTGPGTRGAAVYCAGKRATIVGTAKPDRLRGTPKADVIAARGGNDTISGLGGNDIICGSLGNDTLSGGTGNDKLYGGFGRDRLLGGLGRDTLSGGAQRDVLLGGPGSDKQTQ